MNYFWAYNFLLFLATYKTVSYFFSGVLNIAGENLTLPALQSFTHNFLVGSFLQQSESAQHFFTKNSDEEILGPKSVSLCNVEPSSSNFRYLSYLVGST